MPLRFTFDPEGFTVKLRKPWFNSNVTNQSGYLILNQPWITMNIYLTILDWFQMSSDFKRPLSEETSKHNNQDLLPKGSGNPTTSQEWLSHLQWSAGNQLLNPKVPGCR